VFKSLQPLVLICQPAAILFFRNGFYPCFAFTLDSIYAIWLNPKPFAHLKVYIQ
jgi:hypothetical protein